ncbi:hypothetical protein D1AOALGA4SA_11440 [Olavius algarvensis Delta 1 endosymbiont]|nr:hypothetical protein D1AOALGA4SA_11440 [Olavius algarvensis Delta 1 endosymbiont]
MRCPHCLSIESFFKSAMVNVFKIRAPPRDFSTTSFVADNAVDMTLHIAQHVGKGKNWEMNIE